MKNKINKKERIELANYLKIPVNVLTYILYKVNTDNLYTTFTIPKKNGDERIIHAPYDKLKSIQRTIADNLYEYKAERNTEINVNKYVAHAFEKGKSIITNAKIHRNKRYVFNIDLENFFDSFHFGRVAGFFEKNKDFRWKKSMGIMLAQLTCYKGVLPQGSPCSPIITNLICNILDMRILNLARKYRLDYTRYADDLTFSTNDKKFLDYKNEFYCKLSKEIEKAGFKINESKTRLVFKDSRQEVTGIVVNEKLNVNRDFIKKTRAMADSLYKKGEFFIGEEKGNINQLEGRFSFIDQLDRYNNKNSSNVKHNVFNLNSREREYQKFLVYKYFFSNEKPIIVTEGKTDILYLKAALKKFVELYPELIEKGLNGGFEFKVCFLKKTKRLKYFLNIQSDGADTMKNIYNFYSRKGNFPNYAEYFRKNGINCFCNNVILIFDNELVKNMPLKKFINHVEERICEKELKEKCKTKIKDNLFIVTNPMIEGKEKCAIEDLFDDEVLKHTIDGKSFSNKNKFDIKKEYGKDLFSKYIFKNYESINFDRFVPMLDAIKTIIQDSKR